MVYRIGAHALKTLAGVKDNQLVLSPWRNFALNALNS